MIKLPRPYLSWNALSCWERDPEEYKRRYFFGEKTVFPNKYIEFGKKLAKALETGKKTDDKGIEHARIFIPNFQFREKKIEAKSPTCILQAKMDGFDEKPLVIHEIKSGKFWNQSKVDNHGQLKHYAYTVWLDCKKIAQILLHWVETKEKDDGLVATGKVQTFETKITIQDFIHYELRVKKCHLGIVAMAEELSKSIK